MSLPRRMSDRKRSDRETERTLGIPKNDPTTDAYGGRTYTPADIEDLEGEMVPWLKKRKRRTRS